MTKKIIPTPTTARGKENQPPNGGRSSNKERDESHKTPQFSLEIDDSAEDIEPPDVDEDEDSEIPVAPTPSILPDQDNDQTQSLNDPTITFKSIDFARNANTASENPGRHRSRSSIYAFDQLQDSENDDDPTILTELGRRAVSEEPTGRLSRYSFGSIRMSDFGSQLEVRRESEQQDPTRTLKDPTEYEYAYEPLDLGGETEHLENLRRSPSVFPAEESTMFIPPMDESFQYETVEREEQSDHAQVSNLNQASHRSPSLQDQQGAREVFPAQATLDPQESPQQPTINEAAPAPSQHRQKKLKMTRRGTLVPSLPRSMIKRVATEAQSRHGNRKPKLGREHMQALEQATEWFFEQVGEDLEAYSDHARRKKRINSSDVLMLMGRQRVLQGDGELRKAARELLPEENVVELDREIA